MEPHEIIRALEAPAADRRPVFWALEEGERAEDLATALTLAEDAHTRQLLADLLGFQAAPGGVAALLAALNDREHKVRSSAADALGKVFLEHPDLPERDTAGAALLTHAEIEPETATRTVLLTALGTTRYEPARATLHSAAGDPDERIAKAAAWALDQYGSG
jgi:HEAT repeat protein